LVVLVQYDRGCPEASVNEIGYIGYIGPLVIAFKLVIHGFTLSLLAEAEAEAQAQILKRGSKQDVPPAPSLEQVFNARLVKMPPKAQSTKK
jgi:hypothetical protein